MSNKMFNIMYGFILDWAERIITLIYNDVYFF